MRYYYDCPIVAAYMMKEFNFKFFSIHSDEQMSEFDLQENEREFNWLECCSMNYGTEIISIGEALDFIKDASGRIYIDSACHALLKPQVGDLVSVNNGESANKATHEDFILSLEAMKHQFVAPVKIIQRQGKAFFQPIREE